MLSENKKYEILREVLRSFANGKEVNEYRLNGNIKKLQEIYQDDFRHQYSKIFLILTEIDKDSKLSIDHITEVLEQVYQQVKTEKEKHYSLKWTPCKDTDLKIIDRNNKFYYNADFFKKISKLYDHVNLDIARINYMKNIDVKSDLSLQKINDIKNITEEAKNNANEALEKIKNTQKDYIAILGIFASIILAFVTGLSFSTSVLANIDKVSVFRLIFIVCLIALFIFNLLNSLYGFIIRIYFNKDKNFKNNNMLWFNVIIISIMLIDFIGYLLVLYR